MDSLMDIIEFQNGQSPYINGTNLIQLQQNVKNEFNKKLISNVSDLKQKNLKANEVVSTLGYYEAFDGGSAKYIITNDGSLTADDGFVIALSNGLKAKLIIENNTVNIKQLGARSQGTNNTKYDIKQYLERYIDFLDTVLYHVKLYIPSGVYYCSECDLTRAKGFDISGDKGLIEGYANCTVISSYYDNQDYILKIGNGQKPTNNWHLDGITLSAKDFTYDTSTKGFLEDNTKTIIDSALILHYACFGIIGQLEFDGIIGSAIRICACWENFANIINIQNITANSAIIFDTVDTSLMAEANITDSEFKTLRFERIAGNCISFENNCQVSGVHFGNINIEPSKHEITGNTYTDDISGFNGQTNSLMEFNGGASITIGNIQCNNLAYRYYTRNNVKYMFDTIFNIKTTNQPVCIILSKLILHYAKKSINMILQTQKSTNIKSNITITDVINSTDYDMLCNVQGFPYIKSCSLRSYEKAKSFEGKFRAFLKNLKLDALQTEGMLYYNLDCKNDLNLEVRPIKQLTSTGKIFAQFYLANSKMYINAKIQSGSTFQGYIIAADFQTSFNFDLVGTGSYKTYEINITGIDLGQIVYIGARNNTNDVNASFNGYMN